MISLGPELSRIIQRYRTVSLSTSGRFSKITANNEAELKAVFSGERAPYSISKDANINYAVLASKAMTKTYLQGFLDLDLGAWSLRVYPTAMETPCTYGRIVA